MAIVMDSDMHENIGKIVTVGRYLGEVDLVEQKDQWEVSPNMVIGFFIGDELIKKGTCNHQSESRLFRIDDTDTEKQANHETEEDIAR
jgi:hypothetical protein